jgi:hypothetical protein
LSWPGEQRIEHHQRLFRKPNPYAHILSLYR